MSEALECECGIADQTACLCWIGKAEAFKAERDQLKLRAEALDAKCDAQAKEIEKLRKALRKISDRVCDHNTAPCKSHLVAEKAITETEGK